MTVEHSCSSQWKLETGRRCQSVSVELEKFTWQVKGKEEDTLSMVTST